MFPFALYLRGCQSAGSKTSEHAPSPHKYAVLSQLTALRTAETTEQ